MKVNLLYIVSFIFLMLSKAHGQDKTKFISNNSIRFEILRQGLEMIDTNTITPTKYFIKVDLTKKQRRLLKSFSREDWIRLLNDSKSDWAANLVLYDTYEKDAILFNTVLKTRNEWEISAKEKDINYWSGFLK
jgi:hypothetical protein